MTLEAEEKQNTTSEKFVTCPDMLHQDESYVLCVQADALRSSMMFKESISKYLRSILLNRTNLEAYYGLALSYKHLKDFSKAISTLKKALAVDNENKDIYYELGICLLLNGRASEAMDKLRKTIQLDKDNLNAQVQLAIAHELCDEEDMALMIYEKINEEAPKFFQAHQHKAALLMSLEKYKEACMAFSKLLKMNPNYEKALLGIGICFDKLKRFTDAIRYYRKFLTIKPKTEHFEHIKDRICKIKKSNKRFNKLSVVPVK